MVIDYVRYLIFTYLDNIVRRVDRWQPVAAGVAEWIADNGGFIDLDREQLGISETRWRSDSLPSEEAWAQLRRVAAVGHGATMGTPPDLTAQRLAGLGEKVGLSPEDIAILDLLLRYEADPVVENFIDTIFQGRRRRFGRTGPGNPLLGTIVGVSQATLHQRFAASAPLRRTGLVEMDDDQDIRCVGRLHRLCSVVEGELDVRELLLGGTRTSSLEWSDFDHLGQNRDDVESLLRGALERGRRGVNILVHGAPGTGKTEFCRVLAARIGADLFSVGEVDESGGEPTRGGRLAELLLAQSLLGEDRKAVLLFDEMEDLLSEGGYSVGRSLRRRRREGGASKVFMNRLLEESPVPTLWTTNVAGSIDRAILRRMMFAVEMRQPPPRIRARIWARQMVHHGIDATLEDAAALAREFDATPGVAAGATAAAELAAGDFDAVRRGVRSLSRVLGCERPPAVPAVCFDTALIEGDIDVEGLAARLVASGQRPFSLCLNGPPGSGKSAYVRHLAERIGLEVMQKRTSDLLDKWVGSTERNIARAFTEARDDDAFLVFDEADSLLADRRHAVRNWEIGQVNEMLTWMESHPLPFACTTNLADRLDGAALRRFVFKVKLGYLKPPAIASAFRAFFGVEAPASLSGLEILTPGDFEVVRRKAAMLGQLGDVGALAAMLRSECDAKPDRGATIGFVR